MLKIFQKNPIRVPITRHTSDYSLLVHLYLSMYLRLSSPGLAWFFPGTMGSIPEFWIDAGYWSRFLFLIFTPCSRDSDLDPHCFRCRLDNHIRHCKVTYSLISLLLNTVLPVGHTREDINAMFSNFSSLLKQDIMTLESNISTYLLIKCLLVFQLLYDELQNIVFIIIIIVCVEVHCRKMCLWIHFRFAMFL